MTKQSRRCLKCRYLCNKLINRETVEIFQEGLLICELQCPAYWSLKAILLEMERQLSYKDSLVLSLFDGPYILNTILLESCTLADIRIVLKEEISKYSAKSKCICYLIISDIRVNLIKTQLPIKEKEIISKIFSKIRNSEKFFQILEDLLSLDDLQNRSIILDILSHLGSNTFYQKSISNKISSPDSLLQKNNITQSLVYLNYGTSNVLYINNFKCIT